MATNLSRRRFIRTSGLALAGLTLSSYSFASSSRTKIKAIAFDAFPIFDPRPVFQKVSDLFPEKGRQLIEVWRAKQFSYQWLRVVGGKYKNFWNITEDALSFAAAECEITLSAADLKIIMNEYTNINIWPDVLPGLQQLRMEDVKLGFLTNMTEKMISKGIQNSGTKDYFAYIISTDQIRTYKPSPAAYQLGVDTLKLKKEEILFVAFASWDVAGSKWFGYPTFWINRPNSTADHLDAEPDGIGKGFSDLIDFVKQYNKQ